MTAPIPSRTVKHDGLHLRYLVIEETEPGDDTIQAWIGDPDDGPAIALGVERAKEVVADLQARIDLISDTSGQAARAALMRRGTEGER